MFSVTVPVQGYLNQRRLRKSVYTKPRTDYIDPIFMKVDENQYSSGSRWLVIWKKPREPTDRTLELLDQSQLWLVFSHSGFSLNLIGMWGCQDEKYKCNTFDRWCNFYDIWEVWPIPNNEFALGSPRLPRVYFYIIKDVLLTISSELRGALRQLKEVSARFRWIVLRPRNQVNHVRCE